VKAVVAGAGPIGLATAMLLARVGWEVKVYEKDAQEPPPEPVDAWSGWERPGVAQFRMPHIVLPRLRQALESELPLVRDRLEALGARRLNLIDMMAPTVADRSRRPGDERFETLTARRPVLEAAFAQVAVETPGVEVIRGRGISALVASAGRVPHVTGVVLSTGQQMRADLVVDAMGRRSRLPDWIEDLGGVRPHEEALDQGFAYYCRHFRSVDGGVPEVAGPIGGPLGSLNVLTSPGDNRSWTVALIPLGGDSPLKSLKHVDAWTRVARAIPRAARWVGAGEPITGVLAMAGVLDRYRRFVVEGRPVATGVVAVGDAWACTNPQAGRGITLGLLHALGLRDIVRDAVGDPVALALRFDAFTEAELTPWYRDQVERDLGRAAAMRALIDGVPPPSPSTPQEQIRAALLTASAFDADAARAFLDVFSALSLPRDLMGRPGLHDTLMRYAGVPAPQPPGPSREELLALLEPTTSRVPALAPT
jgi:2-polyprenyl-6-methoxyphenol hydroxylase-like FAD-dependent oxidoreductase